MTLFGSIGMLHGIAAWYFSGEARAPQHWDTVAVVVYHHSYCVTLWPLAHMLQMKNIRASEDQLEPEGLAELSPKVHFTEYQLSRQLLVLFPSTTLPLRLGSWCLRYLASATWSFCAHLVRGLLCL